MSNISPKTNHIFWVHSNFTYHFAKYIIHHEKIPNNKVIFITSRNLITKREAFKTFALPFNHNSITTSTKYGIIWAWYKILQLLLFIFKINKLKTFELYLPLTHQVFTQILISLPLCKNFNYFEEGLLYYTNNPEEYKLKQVTVKEKIGYMGLYKGYNYLSSAYNKIYVTNKNATLFKRDKIVLNYYFSNLPTTESSKKIKLVLAFDAFSFFNGFKQETHKIALTKTLNYIIKNYPGEILYYKFHPTQYGSNEASFLKETLESQLNDKIYYEELPKDFFLETLIQNKNIVFFINISSIGFYAALHRHKVLSYARIIAEIEPHYKNKIEKMGLLFNNVIKYL